ncbi:hyaluronidase PH-20 isoform X1 [Etheostoma spectabile]|uniref:hyaluronidase PH-20 isoform X1 n=2 Tax=Etheostoma spectabile TaxID=54343 RepID=UPI0013AFB579|nr:hyaluronidase PH-20-like isoform X1 [Etheostoma spectabile]
MIQPTECAVWTSRSWTPRSDEIKMSQQHFLSIFIITMSALLCSGRASPRTAPPIRPGHPFQLMWNAPTELCNIRFKLPLDLSHFQSISSTLKTATNQSVSLFYTDRFGIFPYVDEHTGKIYNEGLPQLIDLQRHQELAENNIKYYIPADQPGLAVLDFEEWRPQWNRNWGSKDVYRRISIETIKKKNPSLTNAEAEDRARVAFEHAAKTYFLQSVRVGKRTRPSRLWGYYLFPECYNYNFKKDMSGFTGECPAVEKKRNDELIWLWGEATALFPSIYLELFLRDTLQARLFVRHRIREAMRVSMLPNSSYSIPVFPYIRPLYKDTTDKYMSEFDLVNTIGEAAALGAAGVISWGDMKLTESEDSCFGARRHLEQVMNPYILNVTTATQLCSKTLCQGRGRCLRKHWDDDVFLHLDPRRYRIEQKSRGGPLAVSGGLSQDDVNWFDRNFDCMCYGEEPCRSVLAINVLDETHTEL